MKKLNIPLILKASLVGDAIKLSEDISTRLPIEKFILSGKLQLNSKTLPALKELIGAQNLQALIERNFDDIDYSAAQPMPLASSKEVTVSSSKPKKLDFSGFNMNRDEVVNDPVAPKGHDFVAETPKEGLSKNEPMEIVDSAKETPKEPSATASFFEKMMQSQKTIPSTGKAQPQDAQSKVAEGNDKTVFKYESDIKSATQVLGAYASGSISKNDKVMVKRILGYQGLHKHRLVVEHAFNPSAKSLMLLGNANYSKELIADLSPKILASYDSVQDVLKDVYFQLPEELKESLLGYFSEMEDKDILVTQAHDLSFVRELSENSNNNIFIQSVNPLNETLIDTVCPSANIASPGSSISQEGFDCGIGFIHKDDAINVTTDSYENSYLREDEKGLLRACKGLKKGSRSIMIAPSELSNDSRSAFHQALYQDNSIEKIVRLPRGVSQDPLDVFFIIKEPEQDLSVKISDKLVSVNGKLISDEKELSVIKTSSQAGFNQFIHYQTDSYQSDTFNIQKAVEAGFLAPNTEGALKERHFKSYREDSFYETKGGLYQAHNGVLVEVKQGIATNRVKQFIVLSKALNNLYKAQKKQIGVDKAFKTLNDEYDAFVSKFGPISLRKNERPLASDPRYTQLLVLEDIKTDKKTGEEFIEKTSVFTKPVFNGESSYTNRQNIALTANQYFEINANFNMNDIASIVKASVQEVTDYLIENQVVFKVGDEFIHKDIYLTGDVSQKLEQAQELAKYDNSYHRNVMALQEVMPEAIPFDDVFFSIGSHWMPKNIIEGFLNSNFPDSNKPITIEQNPLNLSWSFNQEHSAYLRLNQVFSSKYSFSGKTGLDVLMTALNGLSTNIFKDKSIDVEKTEEFKQKVAQMQEDFKAFIDSSKVDKAQLEETYNDIFNSYKKIEFNSVMKTLPGMNVAIQLRPHQMSAAQMSVTVGNTLYAHDAGSGKTFTQVVSALLRAKNSKTNGNSIIAVPNHMPRQMLREALLLFPEMNILNITGEMLKDPEKLLRKVNDYPWDAFIVKHSELSKIGVPSGFEKKQLIAEIEKLKSIVHYYSRHEKISKDFVVSLKKLEKRLSTVNEEMALKPAGEVDVNLETLNVETIVVDEAHNFKNLEIRNPTGNMIDTINGSIRAYELKNMVDFIYARNRDDVGIIFATGTPISNSLLEIFNLHQYLQPKLLKKLGLDNIKNWADTFLEIKTDYEPDATGQNFVLRNRYVLKNIPELMNILSTVMNVVTIADAGIEVPDHKMVYENIEMDDKQKEIAASLVERMEKIMKKQVKNKVDNKLKIISDGRKLALSADMILSEDGAPKMSPKLRKSCENIFAECQKSQDTLGAQLVFCDLGTPSGFPGGNSIYDVIKNGLIEMGMKPAEIAFIHDAKKDADKDRLFAKVREGSVRVLIGSTAKMGEGTNVQERLVASHDIDPPWRPKDVIQRRRRTVRQGNTNDLVTLYVYTTGNSFDAYAWATLDAKNKAFGHIMSGKVTQRSFELDIDPSFAETYALVTGNPLLIEKSKLENELITLNAKKSNVERQYNNFNRAIHLNTNSIKENEVVISRLSSINFNTSSAKGWTIDGVESTRQDVLKKRHQTICFNGMQVVFNNDDKIWTLGGFDFKRPADIEKQMDFDYQDKLKVLEQSIKDLRLSTKSLEEELQAVDATIYDVRFAELIEQVDALEAEIDGLTNTDSSSPGMNK